MNGNNYGDISPVEEDSVVVKEECVSSDDDEEDSMVPCGNAFLCEICTFTDDALHAVFKERSDLVLHTFKNHASTCIGCFENFHTPDNLMKHVMVDSHELPCCRKCWRLFPDQSLLIRHPCQITSASEEEDGYYGTDAEEGEDDEQTVKAEPQSEDEESEFVYSNEDDSSCESGYVLSREMGDLSCIHCTADGFKRQHDLRVHTCKAHPSVCVVCFEGFDDETSLQNHQKALNHTIWKCVKCDMYFLRKKVYRIHVTNTHPEEWPYECSDCNWKGPTRHQLADHRRQLHISSELQSKNIQLNWQIFKNKCNICLKTYMTGYSLLLHMFREHNEPGQTHVYKCELCQLGFGPASAFEIHLKQDHADDMDYLNEAKTLLESTLSKSLNCEVCGERRVSHGSLQRHIISHHPELRPHKCNICGAQYPEESDVRVHVWSEHEGPPGIVCPVCDFSGREPSHLESHLKRRHKYKEMPYIYCFVHKKRFPRFPAYRKHFELTHLDPADRPVRPPPPKTGFPCHLCPKEFGTAYLVKYHVMRVHHPGEKVKCDVCGKLLKSINTLATHKMIHTDEFKCEICNKTFQMQFALRRHQVVHSGEKPFQCELCGLKVSQHSSLQRHIKVVHASGKPLKPLRARKTRGPKHEGGMNQEKKIDEKLVHDAENRSIQCHEVHACDSENDTAKKDFMRSRKRRKDSKSPSDESSKTTMLPKRRRGRPRKKKAKEEERHINDDVKANSHRRGRPRKSKEKAEEQIHQQVSSDNDSFLSNDEEFLLLDDNDSEDE